MKAKPIIVVVVTLIIGFVLGMLTSAQIRYHKLKPVSVYFSEERFRDGFYRAIEPDDQQKAKIDVVLDKYALLNSELQNNFRKQLDANMIDFRKELDLNLTKEQLARLKDMDDKRQEMIRGNRKNHDRDSSRFREGRPHNEDERQNPPGSGRSPFPQHDSARLPDKK
ncbi:MAG TPA: hypothetical protein VIK07_12795 [Bacteroidales bacterium]